MQNSVDFMPLADSVSNLIIHLSSSASQASLLFGSPCYRMWILGSLSKLKFKVEKC